MALNSTEPSLPWATTSNTANTLNEDGTTNEKDYLG